ncbi:MAG: hypothetical protein NBKEAIPA_03480 [Nitrospirae bacterium]|nr:MAG: hypothetical protein UZ03_NOB001000564 [Nitrospira sp. OLB3]MBV6471548.1 hypothetical protein [Nitrospirota bacterium]MCE7966170.1 hypothetical protein [Nitrospira sp. NTP2]MCK6492080.1 hypothetical protein [Nitrospira sp.]MEB2339227.1 hypothetical protein [Nitrospirales bacterium]
MTESLSRPPVPPWLYKLFTGHQYPYVRRQAKFANRDFKPGEERPEPTREEIDAKFWEIYPRCSAKILQEVKSGMIVVFHELGEYPPGGYQALVDAPEDFLAATYGKKKIKVNFYDGENFVCTINFKVGGWTGHDHT